MIKMLKTYNIMAGSGQRGVKKKRWSNIIKICVTYFIEGPKAPTGHFLDGEKQKS